MKISVFYTFIFLKPGLKNMKIKFTLLGLLTVAMFYGFSQTPISLSTADMPTVGFSETYAVDTPLTSVNYGSAGANQVYDFSALTNTHTTAVNYLAPTVSQQSSFPGCNLALTSDGSSFILLTNSATKYQAVGLQGYDYGLLVITPIQPAEDLFHFPTQYGSHYASKDGFYQGFQGFQVNAPSGVDSVREIFTDNFSYTVDGWGKVITPVGSYRALRLKRVDTTVTEIDAYYGLFGDSWHTVSGYPMTQMTTEYSYLAKETKGAVVSFTYDSAGDMLDAQYSLIPPAPPIAGFSFVTGAAGLVTFTDTSEGYPTQYHWSFGDGDTSNVADPTHTYATNGTYYVCETVYNASGSNTYCDSVHITSYVVHLPPVANNDFATVVQPHGDTINVTANDNSPSNDSFCVTTIYGGQYFSVLGCNDVAFNPSPTFSGYDTCYYVVCNTGQPTLCDTAEVIVDVTVVVTHLPPVAVNDTALDIENTVDVINVTSNDHSPSSDPFCVTSVYGPESSDFTVTGCNNLTFTPAANFTGYDTCYYIVCNTGEPTLCDTARVIVDVRIGHVPPVATGVTATFLQPASGNVDVTVNDYSPSSDSFCISTVYGGVPGFTVANCNNLSFNPDSSFTGTDTAWYVICNVDQPTLCDTASVVVTVNPNPALLPHTNFGLFENDCDGVVTVSAGTTGDSLIWTFQPIDNSFYSDTSIYGVNTAQYGFRTNGLYLQVCLTSSNRFGTTTKCDTTETYCTGIQEIALTGIRMYPNPASTQLNIDMRDNTSQITRNYAAIIIYNTLGEAVETVNKNGLEVVSVPVNQLPAGIYLATIVDGKGAKSVLGKFTVIQ